MLSEEEKRLRRNVRDRDRRAADPEKARAYAKARYAANREKILAQGRARRAANHERQSELKRIRHAANPEKERAQANARYARNPESKKARERARYARNPEKYRAYQRARRVADPQKVNAQANARSTNRYKLNLQFKLSRILRGRVRDAIHAAKVKKSFQRAVPLLGCTLAELAAHIEKQFQSWMSWENYGYKTWHIDHIKPLARFDLTDPEQVKQAFHYTNLRPLHWRENISKGAKVS